MSDLINDALKDIINADGTLKVVATIDKNGVPHVVFKGSLHTNNDGNIVFYELLESSESEKNLVHSLWFDKRIAINVLDKDKNSFEIIGKPVRCITCGKEFEEVYVNVRQKLGDVDLSAIWIIEPEWVRNETFAVRFNQEEEKYPIIHHLDRRVKQG